MIELSPFIIATERETGWSANEIPSATRTKQALKDVPVNIDAITSDFMEDLGLFTADEIASFVANVYAAPPMEDKNLDGDFSFRRLSQSNNVSRNYFRCFISRDTTTSSASISAQVPTRSSLVRSTQVAKVRSSTSAPSSALMARTT